MMNKLPRSHQGKEKSAFWLLNPASKVESFLLSLFFLLLPTQLGKHFWPDFTLVSGIRIDYLSPTVYVTDILLVLLFGFFIFRWVKTQLISKVKNQSSKPHLKSKKFLFIGLVVLFLLCNINLSSRPILSLYGFVKLAELSFLTIYLAKTIKNRFHLQWISLLFVVSTFFESLLAIFQYLNQGSLNGIFYFFGERFFTGATPGIANASIAGTLVLRPYGTFPHPNVLAGYLLIAMVLVWSFVLSSKKLWIKGFSALMLIIASIALLLTFSRVVIFLWGLLLLKVVGRLLLREIKSLKKKVFITSIIVIGFVIIATLPIAHDVFLRFSDTSLKGESVTERVELLSASWKIIQQHPLIGVGLDNFIPALAPLQKPLPLGLYLQPVHNILFLVAAETGIIGLGLFIWLLLATSLRIKKQESRIRGTLFVLLVIILLTGMFDHYWLTLQQGQLLFATVLGLSWTKLQNSI